MKDENKLEAKNCPAMRLADELRRGACLIGQLGDAVYRRKNNRSGSVGGHFRHNLEFVEQFLIGTQTGRIDYGARVRDAEVENDRGYAMDRFAFAELRLRRLSTERCDAPVSVRSEIDPHVWHESTVGREIEFIHSHTVHHHALIAEKLGSSGVSTEFGFGVAPSTLKYWAEEKSGAGVASYTGE